MRDRKKKVWVPTVATNWHPENLVEGDAYNVSFVNSENKRDTLRSMLYLGIKIDSKILWTRWQSQGGIVIVIEAKKVLGFK